MGDEEDDEDVVEAGKTKADGEGRYGVADRNCSNYHDAHKHEHEHHARAHSFVAPALLPKHTYSNSPQPPTAHAPYLTQFTIHKLLYARQGTIER